MTLQDLANKFAYQILTCDGSAEDIDSALQSWSEGDERDDVTVGDRFEDCDPWTLSVVHESLADAFLEFHKKANTLPGSVTDQMLTALEAVLAAMGDTYEARDNDGEALRNQVTQAMQAAINQLLID